MKSNKIIDHLILLFLLSWTFSSCINKQNQKNIINYMQSHIDSANQLYGEAIADIDNGLSDSIVYLKYSKKIQFHYGIFKACFDSIGREYMNRNISEQNYGKIMEKLKVDTIEHNNIKLRSKGVFIELK